MSATPNIPNERSARVGQNNHRDMPDEASDDLEPNGNRLDDTTEPLTDQRRPQRLPDKFGKGFDPKSLQTASDCTKAIAEIDLDIANMKGRIAAYEGDDRSELPPETMAWLVRANTALKHRQRIRRIISQRHGELDGHLKGQDVVAIQAAITERRKVEHELKLAQIAKSDERGRRFRTALRDLVCERYGNEVWAELAEAAGAIADAEVSE